MSFTCTKLSIICKQAEENLSSEICMLLYSPYSEDLDRKLLPQDEKWVRKNARAQEHLSIYLVKTKIGKSLGWSQNCFREPTIKWISKPLMSLKHLKSQFALTQVQNLSTLR